jgi:hypothetical protein
LAKFRMKKKLLKKKQLNHTNKCTSFTTREIERTRNSNGWTRGHTVTAFETWHRDSRSFVRLSHHNRPDNKQHRSVFHAQESTPIHTYEGFVLCKNCLKNFTTFVLRSPFVAVFPRTICFRQPNLQTAYFCRSHRRTSSRSVRRKKLCSSARSRSFGCVVVCYEQAAIVLTGFPLHLSRFQVRQFASSRFANMRDWLRRLLLSRSCCEEFAQGFRFRYRGKESKKESKKERGISTAHAEAAFVVSFCGSDE